MIDLTNLIAEAQGGRGLEMLSRRFNLSEAETRAAIDQLAPAVMAGLRRETGSAEGLQGLIGALASGNHGRYLEGDDTDIVADGNGILGHIFGSKEVSRGVAAQAAEASGIGSGILKQMLPVIAAMVMGALGRRLTGGGGGLGDILVRVLGDRAGGIGGVSGASGSGLGDLLNQVLGGRPARPAGAGGSGGFGDVLSQVLGSRTTRTSSPAGGIGELLNEIFGGNAEPELRRRATESAGDFLGELLGRGTARGMAGETLLDSVNRALRGR